MTYVAFGCPFVTDQGHGQCSVLIKAGKKGAGLGNKIRPVFRRFFLGTGCHCSLGCMRDDRDSCGVNGATNYNFCPAWFVYVS